jgi:hypothetical protein
MTQSRSRAFVRMIRCVAADVLRLASSMVRSHAQLAAENLFLRKQLSLYLERQVKPRRADDATRLTLITLSRLIDWRRLLTVVKPETLIRWHRTGFRLFWRWKSRPQGRPRVPADLRQLIAEMAVANRTLGRRADCVRAARETRDSCPTAHRAAIHAIRVWLEARARLSGVEHLHAESRAFGARV